MNWLFRWLTALVLTGVAAGYILRSRWSVIVVVLGLYAGGAFSWMQHEWGFQWPLWEDFLPASGIFVGILLLTAGLPAGITCRVLEAESQRASRGAGTVQLASALAALLGLLAFTAINVLLFPYIGGLLGLAAVLAGITVMQEAKATGREHLLAICGMIFGAIAAGMQAYEVWEIMREL